MDKAINILFHLKKKAYRFSIQKFGNHMIFPGLVNVDELRNTTLSAKGK